jgi:hypothetical protein
MQRLTEETVYDDAAQRQIIALAAELQRFEREGATLAQLEARAREAGIDPRYVRMAAGNMRSAVATETRPVPQHAPWYQNNELTLLTIGAFLVSQILAVYACLINLRSEALPIAMLLSVALGAVLSRRTRQPFVAMAAIIGSVTSSVIVLQVLKRTALVSPYNLLHSRADYFNIYILIGFELVAVVLGGLLAAGGRKLRDRQRRNRLPNL